MITPKLFILLVCLLQAQRAVGFNYQIDLIRCKESAKDTACFVRGSCINTTASDGTSTPGDPKLLDQFKPDENMNLEGFYCDVIMQIKYFTSSKWHVMMKVTGTGLTFTKGISFNQGETQFSCKPGMTSLEGELSPESFGSGHEFSPDSMTCSITITTGSSSIPDKYKKNTAKPTLLYYVSDQENKVEYGAGGKAFWMMPKENCDVNLVQSKNSTHEQFILNEVDTTLSRFKCKDDVGTLMLHLKEEYLLLKEIYCIETEFTYAYVKKDEAEGTQPTKIDVSTASFEVYCAEEFCSKCDDFLVKDCPGCTAPDTATTAGSCKIAKCPKDMWRKSDGGVHHETTVTCKQSSGNNAGWFMDGQAAAIEGGSCADQFDCRLFSNLKSECPSDLPAVECEQIQYSGDNKTISCTSGFDLKRADEQTTLANITCNGQDGSYNSGDIKIVKNSVLFCQKSPPPAGTSEKKDGGSKAGLAVGISLAVVLIIVGIILFICWRRRRAAPKSVMPSSANSEDMKTGIATNSKEGMAAATKTQSGSEPPPSTDRPSKEKIQESEDVKEKKDEKKEEASADKKEEKEEKKSEKKEEKKEKKEKKKKLTMIPMDMTKKQVPNLKQVTREMEQMKGREPVDMKPNGKRADASDLTTEQIRFAENPDDKMKHWDETVFQDLLLPAVANLKTDHRTSFLHNLTAFEHHRPGGEPECGSLSQFFQVVRRCQDKNLDCLPTWEFINRLVKLLCARLPQKEAANVIERMRKMMREVGHMLIKDLGFTSSSKDNAEMLMRRELGVRILLGAEDPVCLEELRKQGDVNTDDLELMPMQTVLFSHALNRMGKKDEIESKLWEDVKKSAKEDPKAKDRPFGTLRQHLIYALCSDKNAEGMANTLEMVTDPKSRKDQSKPAGEFNATDLLSAYRGALENPVHFDRIVAILETKNDPNFEETLVDRFLDTYTKSQEARAELKKQLYADIVELCNVLAENCISKASWDKLYGNLSPFLSLAVKPGRNAFDSTMLEKRAVNLDTIMKDKKCVEWIDEAMKKGEY